MQRLQTIQKQLDSNEVTRLDATQSLSVTDHRTGKQYNIPVKDNYIKASDLSKVKSEKGDVLRYYDPGYMNTISCTSKISYIDGDKGVLEYRGYPIEQLAEQSTFLEVAFLVIFGELPTANQLALFERKVMKHTFAHQDVNQMMKSFHYDAHPMGQVISTVSALSTFHKEANPALAGQNVYKDVKIRNKQIYRLLGVMPTIAANSYRHRIGRKYNTPAENLGYVENFLYMLDKLNENNYRPNPKLVKALDVLFILHAEHELNCSTSAMRHLASSGVDVYTAIAGSAAALYGPKHGGANEAVLYMLQEIGDVKNIPQFIQDVKDRKKLLMGFGHRVYKNYDPRAKIVKKIAYEVFEVVGMNKLIKVAIELEKIALEDEYFVKRKLYPNVDFYSGLIYQAMGFPTDMFVVLFTIPRVAGWLAHWSESLDDAETKIVRPQQNYKGYGKRDYVPIEKRQEHKFFLEATSSITQARREAAHQYMKTLNK